MYEKQRLDAAFHNRSIAVCLLATVTGTRLCGDAGHNLDLKTDYARSDTLHFSSVLPYLSQLDDRLF